MTWLHDPWVWLGVALALLVLELVVSGYVLLSFSLGAFAMAAGFLALQLALGLSVPEPGGTGALLAVLLAWMLLSGVAALIIWRGWRGRSRGKGAGSDEDVNEFSNRL